MGDNQPAALHDARLKIYAAVLSFVIKSTLKLDYCSSGKYRTSVTMPKSRVAETRLMCISYHIHNTRENM
jgi:hypothetical protein